MRFVIMKIGMSIENYLLHHYLNYYHNKKNIGIFRKNVLSRSFFK